MNALDVSNKKIEKVRVVVNGEAHLHKHVQIYLKALVLKVKILLCVI